MVFCESLAKVSSSKSSEKREEVLLDWAPNLMGEPPGTYPFFHLYAIVSLEYLSTNKGLGF